MPYGRANYRGRGRRYRSKRVKKSTALARKGATSQAKQIIKLQRQVDSINRNVRDNTKFTQYKMSLASSVGEVSGPTFSTWNLIQPYNWEPIFQTRAGDFVGSQTPSKFRGRSIGLEVMAQIGPIDGVTLPMSFDPITCTLFVASLRKETAKQFVDETNNGVDLVDDVHYCKTSMGSLQGEGLVMLNKGYFKLRYVKRFMLGGNVDFYTNAASDEPVRTTNLKDNNRRMYIKLPYKNLIKDAGPKSRSTTAPSGFKNLKLDEIEPHDQLYVFCFANSYTDQAVSLHANMIITGTTAN